MEKTNYENFFAERLAYLRMQKGVSARDMSESLGQASSYINHIENGRSFPSMKAFFHICDYLEVTPQDFFDVEDSSPAKIQELMKEAKALSPKTLDHFLALMKDYNES